MWGDNVADEKQKEFEEFNIYIYEQSTDRGQMVLKVSTSEPDKNILFIIGLLRVRLENNKERMRLKLYEVDKVNKKKELCKLVCNLLEIEKDLLKLREYGTGFMRKDIIDIRHIIEKNLRAINHVEVNKLEPVEDRVLFRGLDIEADIIDIVNIIREYVMAHEEKSDSDLEKDKYPYKFKKEEHYDVPTTACQEVLIDTFGCVK